MASASTAGIPLTGIAALDPRFLAILDQNRVPDNHKKLLGDAGCDTIQMFAHVGADTAELKLFLKRVLDLDPETRGQDAIPFARLSIACGTCRKRTSLEEDTAAQRAVHNLPLQLSVDDHQTARDALDALRRKDGKQVLPDHKIPSENYFEKKCGEMESYLKAEK